MISRAIFVTLTDCAYNMTFCKQKTVIKRSSQLLFETRILSILISTILFISLSLMDFTRKILCVKEDLQCKI